MASLAQSWTRGEVLAFLDDGNATSWSTATYGMRATSNQGDDP